jgi:signal transduction histidine kinase
MMETAGKNSAAMRSMPELLARTIRHEVGDMLQTVYATVAILQKRLPADWHLEQKILADMRSRAEGCKHLLDAIHDFACPISLSLERVDLADLTSMAVRVASARFPQLEIVAEANNKPVLQGDSRRLMEIGSLLLTNAGEAAQRRITVHAGHRPVTEEVEWTITDDGPGVAPEQQNRLFHPFFTTRHAHAGLGLALAQKLVQLHGGTITAANVPHGGFRVQMLFPPAAAGQEHHESP